MSARGWGSSQAPPTGSCLALQDAASPPQARVGTGLLRRPPLPLWSLRLVLGLLSARRGWKRTRGSWAQHPHLTVCGCVPPPPTRLDPSAPSAQRLGPLPWVPLLEPRWTAGTTGGWWSPPLLTWPRSRGARCWLVWAASCLTQASCPHGCVGAPARGEGGRGRGGAGRGWEQGSTGSIFLTAIVQANGNGVILSYCCQRDVRLLLLWECGWGRVRVCVSCFLLV